MKYIYHIFFTLLLCGIISINGKNILIENEVNRITRSSITDQKQSNNKAALSHKKPALRNGKATLDSEAQYILPLQNTLGTRKTISRRKNLIENYEKATVNTKKVALNSKQSPNVHSIQSNLSGQPKAAALNHHGLVLIPSRGTEKKFLNEKTVILNHGNATVNAKKTALNSRVSTDIDHKILNIDKPIIHGEAISYYGNKALHGSIINPKKPANGPPKLALNDKKSVLNSSITAEDSKKSALKKLIDEVFPDHKAALFDHSLLNMPTAYHPLKSLPELIKRKVTFETEKPSVRRKIRPRKIKGRRNNNSNGEISDSGQPENENSKNNLSDAPLFMDIKLTPIGNNYKKINAALNPVLSNSGKTVKTSLSLERTALNPDKHLTSSDKLDYPRAKYEPYLKSLTKSDQLKNSVQLHLNDLDQPSPKYESYLKPSTKFDKPKNSALYLLHLNQPSHEGMILSWPMSNFRPTHHAEHHDHRISPTNSHHHLSPTNSHHHLSPTSPDHHHRLSEHRHLHESEFEDQHRHHRKHLRTPPVESEIYFE